MKTTLLLILSVILSSCTLNNNNTEQFEPLRTFHIQLPNIKSKSAASISSVDLVYNQKTNKPTLVYLYKPDSQFYYVDVFSKQIVKKVNFKNIAKSIGFNSFFSPCYVGLDSIFILSEKDKNIYLIKDNKIVWQTNVQASDLGEVNYEPLSLSQFNLLYNNGHIYVVTTYNDLAIDSKENIHEYFSRMPELGISTQNNQRFRLGKFPSNYLNNFYYDLYPIRCINNKNEIIYSFKNNDTLFVYNKEKLIKRIAAKSKYDLSIQEGMPIENVIKTSIVKKYNVECARYEKIIYDPFRDCYYRVFKPKQSQLNEKGELKKNTELKWSLIVLDANFKNLSEQLFINGDYNCKWLLPTKEGLLISNYCESCQERDLLKFTLLKANETHH